MEARADPVPENSRTTENPFASTCCCTACPRSDTRPPILAHAIERASASEVTRSKVDARLDIEPTPTVTAESP